jgi:hypothetical protein
MVQSRADTARHGMLATSTDVLEILGQLDDAKMVAILELRPTIKDVEEASVSLCGDADVFGPGSPVKGTAAQIVALLTADEEEDAWRSR